MSGLDMNSSGWTHESTYKGRGIAAVMHRRRLRTLIGVYESIPIPEGAAIADFGCSNGFILSALSDKVFGGRVARVRGFDHSERLVEMARGRGVPNAEFDLFDLNAVADAPREEFDIVTCFETLEHVGNYENAFANIFRACKPGGMIVVSMPNEKGAPGIAKYFGRRLLRRNAYDDFFETRNESKYIMSLLLNRPLHGYRQPPADGWGPHLGFDWKEVERFVQREYLGPGQLALERRLWASMRFNLFLMYRKAARAT